MGIDGDGLIRALAGIVLFWIVIIVIAIVVFKRNRKKLYREIEQMHQQQNNDQNLNVNQQLDPSMNEEVRNLYYDIKNKKIILWGIVILGGIVLFPILKAICGNNNELGYAATYCIYFYIGVIAPIIIVVMSNRISVKGWEKLMEKQRGMNQNQEDSNKHE
jgi:Na+/melibiose symporter-like transporter